MTSLSIAITETLRTQETLISHGPARFHYYAGRVRTLQTRNGLDHYWPTRSHPRRGVCRRETA